jgi:mono/diheme cytochrome c family protein
VRKFVKRAAIATVLLVAAAAIALGVALQLGERKFARTLEVRVVPVPYTKDRAALKQGKYLFETRGCAECHGTDGRGIAFIDTPDMRVKSPNITTGAGGVASDYNEGDWVRTIRHGIAPSGRALFIMPSADYNRMTDADLAALVAYVRSLPPVAGGPTEMRLPLMVKALYGLGVVKDAAEKIDHRRPPQAPVPVGATAAHGAYVATMCTGCHRAGFEGGPIEGGPPEWPPAAKLAPGAGSAMARYDTGEKFVVMMRTGKRPDGSEVSKVMPFLTLRNMNDTDLAALYAYLKALPPR